MKILYGVFHFVRQSKHLPHMKSDFQNNTTYEHCNNENICENSLHFVRFNHNSFLYLHNIIMHKAHCYSSKYSNKNIFDIKYGISTRLDSDEYYAMMRSIGI